MLCESIPERRMEKKSPSSPKIKKDMKRLSLALCAWAFSCATAQAQDITKGMRLGAEFGIGSQVELNLRGERALNRYFSWDVLAVKYARELGDSHRNELGIKTGLRATGPFRFCLLAIDLGYTGSTSPHTDWANAFGMDLTAGVKIFRRLYVGYGFSLDHYKHGNDKDHTFRIGYVF